MLRRSFLLFCLLVSSLIATTIVHAQETSYALGTECTEVLHQEGDADQSSGDADRAVPHHHGGCHGHHISTAANGAALDIVIREADLPPPHQSTARVQRAVDPALRPPIA